MKEYDVLEHSADLKILARGRNMEELFINALVGMFESIEPDIVEKEERRRKVEVKPADPKLGLIDFLSEALYQSDVNNEAYTNAKFEVFDEGRIVAELIGFPVKGFREEIKAVTYHDFEITETDQGFEATIIFDI